MYYEFPRETILAGGEYLLVATDPGEVVGSLGPLTGTLHAGPQTLVLRNNSGRILDTLEYTLEPDSDGARQAGESSAKWVRGAIGSP